MSRVAVTDYVFESLAPEKEILEPLGCEVAGRQCKTQEELTALVADADYVITAFAPVSAPVIEAMEKCKVIVRHGVGVDNVDLDAAAARDIPVCNVPDYCTDEVADDTLALILAVTRRVAQISDHVRQGIWKLAVPLQEMRVLKVLTVGIVGFIHIGLSSTDVYGDYRRLKAHGVEFLSEPVEFRPGVSMVYFRGPDGEVCELRQSDEPLAQDVKRES